MDAKAIAKINDIVERRIIKVLAKEDLLAGLDFGKEMLDQLIADVKADRMDNVIPDLSMLSAHFAIGAMLMSMKDDDDEPLMPPAPAVDESAEGVDQAADEAGGGAATDKVEKVELDLGGLLDHVNKQVQDAAAEPTYKQQVQRLGLLHRDLQSVQKQVFDTSVTRVTVFKDPMQLMPTSQEIVKPPSPEPVPGQVVAEKAAAEKGIPAELIEVKDGKLTDASVKKVEAFLAKQDDGAAAADDAADDGKGGTADDDGDKTGDQPTVEERLSQLEDVAKTADEDERWPHDLNDDTDPRARGSFGAGR